MRQPRILWWVGNASRHASEWFLPSTLEGWFWPAAWDELQLVGQVGQAGAKSMRSSSFKRKTYSMGFLIALLKEFMFIASSFAHRYMALNIFPYQSYHVMTACIKQSNYQEKLRKDLSYLQHISMQWMEAVARSTMYFVYDLQFNWTSCCVFVLLLIARKICCVTSNINKIYCPSFSLQDTALCRSKVIIRRRQGGNISSLRWYSLGGKTVLI